MRLRSCRNCRSCCCCEPLTLQSCVMIAESTSVPRNSNSKKAGSRASFSSWTQHSIGTYTGHRCCRAGPSATPRRRCLGRHRTHLCPRAKAHARPVSQCHKICVFLRVGRSWRPCRNFACPKPSMSPKPPMPRCFGDCPEYSLIVGNLLPGMAFAIRSSPNTYRARNVVPLNASRRLWRSS